MAYRSSRYSARRPSRTARSYTARRTRGGYSRARVSPRRRSTRGGSGVRDIRIVIENPTPSVVQRPELAATETRPKRAKF